MSTWHLIASCLLLTVVAVHGRTTIPPPTGCIDSIWNVSDNTNVLNGVGKTASTVDACKAACTADTTCLGFDWDPAATPMCWWTGAWSGNWRNGTATGVTHYQLFQRGICSTTEECIKWQASVDKNVRGGTYVPGVTTLDGCKQACQNSASCVGIDWDPNNPSQQICWLSPSTTTSDAPGVTHYDLVKLSSDKCNATGCVLVQEGGGVLATDPTTDAVYVSDDMIKAVVFSKVPCLDNTMRALFNNCYSYLASDGVSYLRAAFDCGLHLSQPNITIVDRNPTRFALDTSFLRVDDPSGSGSFSLETAANEGFYVKDGAVSRLTSLNWAAVTNSSFYCIDPSFLPKPVIKDTCPLVWSRFRESNIANANPSVNMYHVDLLTCARYCITRRKCAGIGFKEVPKCVAGPSTTCDPPICYLIYDDQPASQAYTQPDESFTYYELQRRMTGTCDSGCLYTWKYAGPLGGGTLVNTPMTEDECRRFCIDKIPNCAAVSYTGSQCTTYIDARPTTGVTYGYALTRVYDRCGVCINSFGTVINATDLNAKNVGPAKNNRECRTACINNPLCRGYEFHLDDSNCYLSVAPSLLTYPSPYLHSDILRTPPICGNGCLFDWRSYQSTSMVNGTYVSVVPAINNEKACREACQNNPACTSIDWTAPSTCWLALTPSVPLNNPGTTLGTTHFELNREKCA